jgi:hypothetical protein
MRNTFIERDLFKAISFHIFNESSCFTTRHWCRVSHMRLTRFLCSDRNLFEQPDTQKVEAANRRLHTTNGGESDLRVRESQGASTTTPVAM